MSFTAPRFTDEGKALQAKAQAGTALKFTKMQLGDGELGSQAIAAMTGLINPLITVGISDVKAGNNYATVKSNFSNSELTTGFYWREIGVFAADPEKPNDRNSDILYCYANAGSLAEYIPAAGSEIVEKIISIPCIIGDAENVSAEIESGIYATKNELKEHIDNKNNPHNVTAKQLGALTEDSLTKETILTKIDVLDIAHGGTGKSTKKEAFDNLAFLGNNPISSTDEDTTQKWGELGNGYAWFYTNGLMINQPYTYMFVISYYSNDSGSVFQIGSEQKSGTVYYRTGNGTGWLMNWTPLLSTNNTSLLATTIQNLLKGGSISVVKSVQRGTVNLSGNVSTADEVNTLMHDVTINSINTNKAMLLIDGHNYTAGNAGARNAFGRIKNETTITFGNTYTRSTGINTVTYNWECALDWQVIEFY